MPDAIDPDPEQVLTKTEPAWVWSAAIPEIIAAVILIVALVAGAIKLIF